jgi:hypothetical protein
VKDWPIFLNRSIFLTPEVGGCLCCKVAFFLRPAIPLHASFEPLMCRVTGQIKRGSVHSTRGRISSYQDLSTQGFLLQIRVLHL